MQSNMKNHSSEVLYISVDGIMEPLGYSQVFKYLEGLSQNYTIKYLLSLARDLHVMMARMFV